MSLDVAFNTALSGLRVAQRALATTSQNIANVQTPGYTKKISTQEALAPGGQGNGVLAGPVRRLFDQSLQQELYRRVSQEAALNVRSSYLRRIEEVQGAPEAGTNIAARLSVLQNAFVELGTTPDSAVLQRSALDAAEDFARTLNDISRTILNARNAANSELGQAVEQINSLLSRIDELDAHIVRQNVNSGGAPDLEDKRDAAITELSELVEVKTLRREDGSILIVTTGGLSLFDRVPQKLEFNASALDHTSFYRFAPPGSIAPITIDADGQKRDVTALFTGGRSGSLLALRDQDLPRMQGELDNLAFQAALRFKSNGLTLFTKADGQSLPGNVPTAQVGFAAEIQVAETLRTDPRLIALGDAGLAVLQAPVSDPTGVFNPPFPLALGSAQITRVLTQVFESATGSSVTPHQAFATRNLGPNPLAGLSTSLPATARLQDYAMQLVAKHAGEHAQVTTNLKEAQGIRLTLEQRYQDKTAVSLDDEMASLQVLQRSYAASSQVLRTIERMTNDLFAVR